MIPLLPLAFGGAVLFLLASLLETKPETLKDDEPTPTNPDVARPKPKRRARRKAAPAGPVDAAGAGDVAGEPVAGNAGDGDEPGAAVGGAPDTPRGDA